MKTNAVDPVKAETVDFNAIVPSLTPTPTNTPTPTPTPTNTPTPTPTPPTASVTFNGRAYPNSTVSLLRDASLVSSTVASQNATFSMGQSGLTPGNYVFSLYGQDFEGRISSLISFPVSLTAGSNTTISGIFIAPTIDTDKSNVKQGETITILGQSAPDATNNIEIHSHQEVFVSAQSDSDGVYQYSYNTADLHIGSHETRSKASLSGEVSGYSKTANFEVGTPPEEVDPCGKADLNCDGRVNLVDFSIAAFWYQKPISSEFATIEATRLSGDGQVNLVDFSIMAFYWTG